MLLTKVTTHQTIITRSGSRAVATLGTARDLAVHCHDQRFEFSATMYPLQFLVFATVDDQYLAGPGLSDSNLAAQEPYP